MRQPLILTLPQLDHLHILARRHSEDAGSPCGMCKNVLTGRLWDFLNQFEFHVTATLQERCATCGQFGHEKTQCKVRL